MKLRLSKALMGNQEPNKRDLAELVFDRWKANLSSMDRSRKAVGGNFDLLFEELHRDGVEFEIAKEILAKAIKAHQPSQAKAKSIYQYTKKSNSRNILTLPEFVEEWNASIANEATKSFYTYFEIKKPKAAKGDVEDAGPKIFGSMSEREYRLQRKFADSFPVLDTEALEKQLQEALDYPEEELLAILGEVDGQDND